MADRKRAKKLEDKRAYNARNRTHLRLKNIEAKRIRLYGLTPEAFTAMIDGQKGKCAACGTPVEAVGPNQPKKACVDHDHKTNVVRGILCFRCNVALGLLDESPCKIEGLLWYARVRC